MSVEELRQLADRLRKGRLVQQSRVMISAINGLPTEVSAGEVREHAHPDAIAAADAIEWLLADRHQAEEAMRERAAGELDLRAERARIAAIGGGMDPMDAQLLDYEYSNAAAAIRSIDTRGE